MATISATELATELSTTPREVRKFLRSVTPLEDRPGKGSTWAIEKRAIRSLRKAHTEWAEAREAAPQDAPEGEPEVEVEVEAEGPTPEDLAAIEDEA